MKSTLKYYSVRFLLVLSLLITQTSHSDALKRYLDTPENNYRWNPVKVDTQIWGTVSHFQLVSQSWRGHSWTHQLLIVKPNVIRNAEIAFFRIAGDGEVENHIHSLKLLAQRAGAITAVLSNVPNQPLYQNRREDALIAYTFNQYLKTGEEDWPLLFPMVKSAVKGMDAIQQIIELKYDQKIKEFLVSGASKRGWTTWLAAAIDDRVTAIAPMVIDTLNMKEQLQWSEQIYGQQSLKIKDYTELNLHRKQDNSKMQTLREWVDPYSYIKHFTMPKLLLLGTNDPYWTVDSLRHYWDQLPEPKLIYQTPNAGHNLAGGKQALQTLAAFFEMIADKKPLPQLGWTFDSSKAAKMVTSQPPESIQIWQSYSKDRDFRNNKWKPLALDFMADKQTTSAKIQIPNTGYNAYLMEAEFKTDSGYPYRLSSEVKVLPDTKPCHCWTDGEN